MDTMRISELARRSGVPATTLRFYETAGLLPADRTSAGHRSYGPAALDRLRFIGAAKRLGLPLDEIAELLQVWTSGACAEVKADLRPRVAARLGQAEMRLAETAVFVASLHGALNSLDNLPDRQDRCDAVCLGVTTADPGDAPARWRSAPVACSLSGDDADERLAQWRRVLDGATRAEVDDGIRLSVPVERHTAVAELAAAEQRCCPFFDFRLHFDGPALHLEVRAPADAVELMATVFG